MRRYFHLLIALALGVTGCELLTHIDASQIPGMSTGGSGGATTGTGGTGGATSSTATTGTGGTGGGTTGTGGTGGGCQMDSDCPGPMPASPCAAASCDMATHKCTIAEVPDGGLADPSVQMKGNCQKVVCDGMGKAMSVPDDTNAPVSTEVCIVDGCSNGTPTQMDVAGPCMENNGKVCATPGTTKAGSCVACNVAADCMVNAICQLNHCVTSSCNDMVQDNGETDVDCGGSCAPCADHLKCLVDADCQSGYCGPTKTCTPASCTDTIQNQGETDIDCGGPVCRPEGKLCGTGKGCAISGDCVSLDCNLSTHVCLAPTCLDAIQNQGETDTDCGGPNCSGCPNGKKCLHDTDCASNGCQNGTLVCVNQCTDLHQDGMETDIDCGGGTCPKCPLGKGCMVDADCSTNACDANTNKCVANQCIDHRVDGVETDTDCGGGTCPTCANGQKCKADGDCTSNGCQTGTLVCANQCMDLHVDGNETDIDCGGGTCPLCANGQKCKVDGDCASNGCQTGTLTCANQCMDLHVDGNETDIDCGGGTCPTCATGLACKIDTDCTSSACDAMSLTCVANQCQDHQQDGMETDMDCGGGTCPVCALGKMCKVDADCITTACDAVVKLCVADQCQDHQQDGMETDVDCGGGTCPTCPNGDHCKVDADCTSGGCQNGTLVCVDQCSDLHKDGLETDTDCGGGTCPKCPDFKGCQADSDCLSNACDALSLTCVGNQCIDDRVDGAETDIDCGGGTCPKCPDKRHCLADSDCVNGDCFGTAPNQTCVSCMDGQQDGNETDTDCGGGCPSGCTVGQKCNVDADCASNACDPMTGACVSSQCADQQQDGAETDVDCGGGTCLPCADGMKCLVGADCQDQVCGTLGDAGGTVCLAPTCSDGVKNGLETDTDCGGPACGPCPDTEHCLVNTDCVNMDCFGAAPNQTCVSCMDMTQDGDETDIDCGGSCTPCGMNQHCLVNGDCTSSNCNMANHKCGP